MIGRLISGFITIVVGTSLFPSIANEVQGALKNNSGSGNGTTNVTGASATVVNLIPLMYALGLMSVGVSITVGGLRDAGIM